MKTTIQRPLTKESIEIKEKTKSAADMFMAANIIMKELDEKARECFSHGSKLLENINEQPERIFEATEAMMNATIIFDLMLMITESHKMAIAVYKERVEMLPELHRALNLIEENFAPLIKIRMVRADGEEVDRNVYKSES